MYTVTWETNFGEQLATRGNEPIPASLPNEERPSTAKANADNASENEADYIITTDCPNDVNDAEHSRDKRLKSDVSNANEDSEDTRNENSDWPDSAVYKKIQKNLCRICPKDKKTMQMFQNEILLMKAMHKNLQKGGMILSCPKYRKMMKGMKV